MYAPLWPSQNLDGWCCSMHPTALTLYIRFFTCLFLERHPVIPLCTRRGATTECIYWVGICAIVERWKNSAEKDGHHFKKYTFSNIVLKFYVIFMSNLYIQCVFHHCLEHHSCHIMTWQMQVFYAVKLQCLMW